VDFVHQVGVEDGPQYHVLHQRIAAVHIGRILVYAARRQQGGREQREEREGGARGERGGMEEEGKGE